MQGKVIQLGILLKLLDKASGPASKVTRSLDQTRLKAEATGKAMQKIGAIMTATGGAMTGVAVKMVSSTFESQKALGELASLGIKDLKVIENAATRTSNRFAGITKPAFITAAYDIKSAISDLTDSAVADYTRLSALTAKATKGSVEQMGDLFATGYGIYKELFPKMSDARFAEVFSGAIAKTVKEFKMTGPKIAEYVSMLGATATKQRVGLAEQFAIGGMLGATMSGSEAATKYTAFLKNPVDAAKKLGLKFTDANNRLLPMADILDRIRGKYGDYIDAVEKGQLVEAFGRIEGVKLVELLIGKTDELRRKTLMVQEAMGQGAQVAVEMANQIDRPIGQRWILFKQQFHNLLEKIGITLEPLTRRIFGFFSKVTIGLQRFVDAHPALTKLGMTLLMVGGAFLTLAGIAVAAGGTFLILYHSFGGLQFMLFAVKYASVLMGNSIVAAVAKASAAIWTFMATNPVGWILLAISAIVLFAIAWKKNWYGIGDFMNKAVAGIVSAFAWLWNQIMTFVKFIISLPGRFWEAGRKLVLSLWEGIKSVAMLPVNALRGILKKLRDMLPFSDPKDRSSPLYGIHKAGLGFVNEVASGIEMGTGRIRRAATVAGMTAAIALSAGMSTASDVTAVAPIGFPPESLASQARRLREEFYPGKIPWWRQLWNALFPAGGTSAYGPTIGGAPGNLLEAVEALYPQREGPGGPRGGLSGGGGIVPSGGTEGGVGVGGMVVYNTYHFERDSINIRGGTIDAESFRKLLNKTIKEELG